MAFERLPGRMLQLPTEGSVAVKPIPPVFPTAAIVQQAIAGILKSIDPVERAKNRALLAYYNQLALNGGVKPLTPQQQATYENTLLHNKALRDAQDKYRLPSEFFDTSNAAKPVASPTQLVTPQIQPSGSLGGIADPRNLKLGSDLSSPELTAPQASNSTDVGNDLANGSLSNIPSAPNAYSMTGDVKDLDALTAQLKAQYPDKTEREIELLAQSMI